MVLASRTYRHNNWIVLFLFSFFFCDKSWQSSSVVGNVTKRRFYERWERWYFRSLLRRIPWHCRGVAMLWHFVIDTYLFLTFFLILYILNCLIWMYCWLYSIPLFSFIDCGFSAKLVEHLGYLYTSTYATNYSFSATYGITYFKYYSNRQLLLIYNQLHGTSIVPYLFL